MEPDIHQPVYSPRYGRHNRHCIDCPRILLKLRCTARSLQTESRTAVNIHAAVKSTKTQRITAEDSKVPHDLAIKPYKTAKRKERTEKASVIPYGLTLYVP